MTTNLPSNRFSDNANKTAVAALGFFQKRSFDEALAALNNLEKLKEEEDLSISHNVSVTEYYQDRCSKPQKLLESLYKVTKRLQDSEAHTDDFQERSLISINDKDVSVVSFNKAVLYYQAKQYASALRILEDLFRNIEPLDDALAVRVCLLLLDVYLSQRLPEKATQVLSFLDKSLQLFLSKPSEGGSPKILANGSTKEKEKEDMGANSTFSKLLKKLGNLGPPFGISASQLRWALHLYRARVQLAAKNTKISKREIKMAMNISNQHPAAIFLKAQLEYSRNNHRKAIKLLSSCPKPPGDHHVVSLYLSNLGCIHFRMRKYNAACFYISKALKENEQVYLMEPVQFEEGEERGEQSQRSPSRTLPNYSKDLKSELLYNMGIQLLLTGNPQLAFQCFQDASAMFFNQPRLWLRLAECCIAVHVLKVKESDNESIRFPQNVYGTGEMRHLLLPVGGGGRETGIPVGDPEGEWQKRSEMSNERSTSPPLFEPASSMASGPITFSFAMRALRNALALLSRPTNLSATSASSPEPSGDDLPQQEGGLSPRSSPQHQAPPSETLQCLEDDRRKEVIDVKQAVFLNMAYAALCMYDPSVAIWASEQLLALPEVNSISRALAHTYAAEALCMVNRIPEALVQLSPQRLMQLLTPSPEPSPARSPAPSAGSTPAQAQTAIPAPAPFVSPYSPFGGHPAFSSEAKSLLYANLACIYALQNDLTSSQQTALHALSILPSSAHAILILVYIELKKGNKAAALDILRRRRPTPSSNPLPLPRPFLKK